MKPNKLERLFDRLRQDGWYCGWNHACCSSCAWMDVPDYFDAKYDKEGYLIREDKDGNPIEYKEVDLSKVLFNHEQDCEIDPLDCDEQKESCFCFDGRKEGVANLKAILPIIEEMGCTYNWNGKGDMRISIDWE